jgi:uncharacterized protein (DUF2336 family)
MVAYQRFVELCQSGNSEERGQAAHLAALAYLAHQGPADEQAALYAALIGFLDDPSVKVRAALAYGLLHSRDAPRPILLSLLQDSAIISRALVQYSPALIDADLVAVIRQADLSMLLAVSMREAISPRVAEALVACGEKPVMLKLLARRDVSLSPERFCRLATEVGEDAHLRGALLAREDLPASARLTLIDAVRSALMEARIVKGAIAPKRLQRLMRDVSDTALTAIGEQEAAKHGAGYVAELVVTDKVSTRVMLHAIVNGHVLFFADCVAELSETPRTKVFALLEGGSRAALNALLSRCGIGEAVRNVIVRLIHHARNADLADDVAARHFVVTALTEELIIEHKGVIPAELEDAFTYLSDQNVSLARHAARGVMAGFAGEGGETRYMQGLPAPEREMLALPAA